MAGAAAAAAAGVLLPAVGAAEAAGLRRSAANPTVLVVHLNFGNQPWPPDAAMASLMKDAVQPLLTANPGLEIRWSASNAYQGGTQASLLAGAGPDIFADWIWPGYVSANLALDLEPYVRQDNLNLSLYEQGQLSYLRQVGQGALGKPIALPALPEYVLPQAMGVNLGILDKLGLKYPQPNWTYKEWETFWRASTVKSSGTHPGYLGLDLGSDMWVGYDHSYNMPGPWIMAGFGGEYVNAQNRLLSALSSPGSIACGEWIFGLMDSGAAQLNWNGLSNGSNVSALLSGQYMITAAESLRSLKWDLFALPVWPVAPTSYTSTDSLGIWAGTKNPDAAWTALKFFSYEVPWQRFQMRVLLLPPSLRNLTAEWVALMRQMAPPLRYKNLEVWTAQADANQQYVGNVFRYSSPETQGVISNLSGALSSHKVSVAAGFAQAARQLDAIQSSGRAVAAQQAGELRAFVADTAAAARAPATYEFPAPPRTGVGVAPVTDSAQVQTSAGKWTVTGGGSGVNGISNGLTFACAPVTAAGGTFTCRLVAIEAVKPNTLNGGSKFGLMARGDLSDTSAEVGIEVAASSGTPGIHAHAQPTAGDSLGDFKPGSPTSAGLIAGSTILAPIGKAAKNFLLRPVWLRIVRQVDKWAVYSSLDGKQWSQAVPPMGAEIAGAWLGLYVTSHNNGGLVRAVFDHVSGFTPTTFVRIGAP